MESQQVEVTRGVGRQGKWFWLIPASLIVAVLVVIVTPTNVCTWTPAHNEKLAAKKLKQIADAQEDYRKHGDPVGRNGYWREDIAGLYSTKAPDGRFSGLIELAVALADGKPADGTAVSGERGCTAGYWYRALKFSDENAVDVTRWAACAYPDSLSSGKVVLISSNKGDIFKKAFDKGGSVGCYPADPEREGWERVK